MPVLITRREADNVLCFFCLASFGIIYHRSLDKLRKMKSLEKTTAHPFRPSGRHLEDTCHSALNLQAGARLFRVENQKHLPSCPLAETCEQAQPTTSISRIVENNAHKAELQERPKALPCMVKEEQTAAHYTSSPQEPRCSSTGWWVWHQALAERKPRQGQNIALLVVV